MRNPCSKLFFRNQHCPIRSLKHAIQPDTCVHLGRNIARLNNKKILPDKASFNILTRAKNAFNVNRLLGHCQSFRLSQHLILFSLVKGTTPAPHVYIQTAATIRILFKDGILMLTCPILILYSSSTAIINPKSAFTGILFFVHQCPA